jgi:hypothetical protein
MGRFAFPFLWNELQRNGLLRLGVDGFENVRKTPVGDVLEVLKVRNCARP